MSDSKSSNSLVVKNTNNKKIVFNDKVKYENAVEKEEALIERTEDKIESLEEQLKELVALEKEMKEQAKKEAEAKKAEQAKKAAEAKKAAPAKKPAPVKKETKPAVVKKPTPVKKPVAAVTTTATPKVDYEKLYAVELETLRVASEVLPDNIKKEFNKRAYKMIDKLIEKKYIEKLH